MLGPGLLELPSGHGLIPSLDVVQDLFYSFVVAREIGETQPLSAGGQPDLEDAVVARGLFVLVMCREPIVREGSYSQPNRPQIALGIPLLVEQPGQSVALQATQSLAGVLQVAGQIRQRRVYIEEGAPSLTTRTTPG